MQKLTGRHKDKIIADLAGTIVENPDGGGYELVDMYMSGNIREKLNNARAAAQYNKKYEVNVRMLESAMPTQYSPSQITPKIGASWIPVKYVEEFVNEYLQSSQRVTITHSDLNNTWNVANETSYNKKYGTFNTSRLLECALNMTLPTVRDGKGNNDAQSTQESRVALEQLKQDFTDWAFKNEVRRNELTEIFNKKYRSYKNLDYKSVGQRLMLPNLQNITPYEHQRGAIARVLFGGNTLLAHGVGSGKTAEMIISAMELKRTGVAHKIMFAVPNNKVTDFRNDILKYYPTANVLAADDKDFSADRRGRMLAKIAANNYDIVVVGHSQFGFIPISSERRAQYYQTQIDELDDLLNNYYEEKKRNASSTKRDNFVKDISKAILKYKEKLKDIVENMSKDNTMTFEELGIDSLFVDEAHNFKRLPYYTKMNVPGASGGSGSQRAQNMHIITDYLNKRNGRIVFATATPITNSMYEMYNMMRYLAPEILEEHDIRSFDAWASSYATIENILKCLPMATLSV